MLYCLQQIGCCSYNKARVELKAATGIEVTHLDICSFQERVGKPFIRLIKDNISSWFRSSKDVFSSFSIFDPKKVPPSLLMSYLYYGDSSIQTLVGQLGRDLQDTSLGGTELEKAAIASSDLRTELEMYCQLFIMEPKDDTYHMYMQLKELLTNDMLIALFPNLHKLATICLSTPISIASAEQSFSDMK